MRFIIAIVLFVVAFVGIGLGIAQRTVFAEADRVTESVALDSTAPVTVIDGSALNAFDGRQTLAILGGADMLSVFIRQTLVQIVTPDHMRGRVAAVATLFVSASNELGAFESGVAARLLGVVPSVLFGGVMTIIVVVLTAWRAPQLRRLR